MIFTRAFPRPRRQRKVRHRRIFPSPLRCGQSRDADRSGGGAPARSPWRPMGTPRHRRCVASAISSPPTSGWRTRNGTGRWTHKSWADIARNGFLRRGNRPPSTDTRCRRNDHSVDGVFFGVRCRVRSNCLIFRCRAALAIRWAPTGAVMNRNRVIRTSCKLMPSTCAEK